MLYSRPLDGTESCWRKFDPEQGPRYSFHDLVIPRLPASRNLRTPHQNLRTQTYGPGDLAELKRVPKSVADQISDPKPRLHWHMDSKP